MEVTILRVEHTIYDTSRYFVVSDYGCVGLNIWGFEDYDQVICNKSENDAGVWKPKSENKQSLTQRYVCY